MIDYWRTKTAITFVFITGMLILSFGFITEIPNDTKRGRYYDCSMAEWHPDIPIKVKEACRARRK